MIKLFLIGSILFCSTILYGQSTGDYRTNSTGGGNWNLNTTWETYNGSSWITPPAGTYPDASDGAITIQQNDAVILPGGVSIQGDEIYIESNGSLTIQNAATLDLVNGSGNDLIIFNGLSGNGILNVYGRFEITNNATAVEDNGSTTSLLSPATTTYYNGSVVEFKWQRSPGDLPGGTWETGSTIEITSYTRNRNAPGNLDQEFYNFVWNCPNQRRNIDLNGALTTVNGDLTISDAGRRSLALTTNNGPYTIDIGGDLVVSGDARFIGSERADATFNIGGSLLYSSSNRRSYLGTNGDPVLNIAGDLSVTGGRLNIPEGRGNGSVNLQGDFFVGTGAEISNGNRATDFNFTGSAVQLVTTNGTNSAEFDYYVQNGSIVDLNTSYLSGDGTFTLSTGGKILAGSTDPGGALQDNNNGGNIRVDGNRVFESGSTIEYNGAGAQFLGDGYPVSGLPDLIINNSNGVTTDVDALIASSATLSLLNGALTIGPNTTLTIEGELNGTGTFVGGTAANMIIAGNGDLGTVTFSSQPQLASLELNRNTNNGGFSLGSDLIVDSFTQIRGNIRLNGHSLTINGDYSLSTGNINSTSASSLVIAGSGTLPASVRITGGVINTLTMDRAGATLNLPATITIANLNILSGTLNNTGTLTIAPAGTITRANGSMTSSPANSTTGEAYNIIYDPTVNITSGPEFSSNTDVVNNVTKNGTGTLILGNDYTINGTLTLNDGIFNAGTTTLTLKGDLISNASSDMTNGLLIFDGTTVISGGTAVSAGDVEINSAADVTFPSGNINIAGNFDIFTGAVFNHNNGTITLNGSADQSIAVDGNIINNMQINKTAGDVILSNSLNLIGSMDFSSGTTLITGGSLTILSTSDGATGNGRIGTLPAGALVSGDVTVQRYMSGKGKNMWRHFSSPISNATINDLLDDFTPLQSLYDYDDTLGGSLNTRWIPVSAPSTPLNVGVGYIVALTEDTAPIVWDLTGPVNQGPVNYAVTYSGSSPDDGWNHLGNPYPSTINWDQAAGWSKTNIGGTVYVRDFDSGIYRSWNGSTGSLGSGDIATGQAFFIVATGPNPGISINENAKTSSTGAFYRKKDEELLNLLVVNFSDGERIDQTYIKFQEDATIDFDQKYDGYKLDNDSLNLASYFGSGTKMCINYLPTPTDETVVNLDIYKVKGGSYSLSFEKLESFESGYSPILVDTYKKVQEYIRDIDSYPFEIDLSDPASFGRDRFKIVFQPLAEPEIKITTDELLAYPNPSHDFVVIELPKQDLDNQDVYNVFVYEVSNSKLVLEDVMRNNGNNYQLNIDLSNFGRGIYLVVVNSKEKRYYTKFIKQ